MNSSLEMDNPRCFIDDSEGNLIGIFALPPRTETRDALLAQVREMLRREGQLAETQQVSVVET